MILIFTFNEGMKDGLKLSLICREEKMALHYTNC